MYTLMMMTSKKQQFFYYILISYDDFRNRVIRIFVPIYSRTIISKSSFFGYTSTSYSYLFAGTFFDDHLHTKPLGFGKQDL